LGHGLPGGHGTLISSWLDEQHVPTNAQETAHQHPGQADGDDDEKPIPTFFTFYFRLTAQRRASRWFLCAKG